MRHKDLKCSKFSFSSELLDEIKRIFFPFRLSYYSLLSIKTEKSCHGQTQEGTAKKVNKSYENPKKNSEGSSEHCPLNTG